MRRVEPNTVSKRLLRGTLVTTRLPLLGTSCCWLIAVLAGAPSRERAAHFSALSDSVRIPKSRLSSALLSDVACKSPDAGIGLWSNLPRVVQAGAALVLRSGRAALFDRDESAVRIYETNGMEVARFGRKGAGPGEFSPRAILTPWRGDTVAVLDPTTLRISLFVGGRLDHEIPITALGILLSSPVFGRFQDGSLLFLTGRQLLPSPVTPYRAAITLVRWKTGTTSSEFIRVRDSVLAPQYHVVPANPGPVYQRVNLGRSAVAAVLGDHIALYDSSRPQFQILTADGRLVRAILLELEDPPVTEADRDSVADRWRLVTTPTTPNSLPLRSWFPERRPVATWYGADASDGLWFGFHPPTTKRAPVFIRFTAMGLLDRCYRQSPGVRAAAFARDRVLTITETVDGDVVNAERTVAFPRR